MMVRSQYDGTPPSALAEAVAWSIRILERLLEVGALDRFDAATVRSVIAALTPAENPKLRPIPKTATNPPARTGQT